MLKQVEKVEKFWHFVFDAVFQKTFHEKVDTAEKDTSGLTDMIHQFNCKATCVCYSRYNTVLVKSSECQW